MTSARVIEYRITRDLMERDVSALAQRSHRFAEHLIAIVAAAVGLLVFGSYLPELVAAGVAGSAVWVLGHS
ncbi:MAG: hypothetical protein V7720_16230 [Halioglobus sp.]